MDDDAPPRSSSFSAPTSAPRATDASPAEPPNAIHKVTKQAHQMWALFFEEWPHFSDRVKATVGHQSWKYLHHLFEEWAHLSLANRPTMGTLELFAEQPGAGGAHRILVLLLDVCVGIMRCHVTLIRNNAK